MIIWWNLCIQNSTIYSFFREPCGKLAEPLDSAEFGLKTTVLLPCHIPQSRIDGPDVDWDRFRRLSRFVERRCRPEKTSQMMTSFIIAQYKCSIPGRNIIYNLRSFMSL